jgi:hypothetical protein
LKAAVERVSRLDCCKQQNAVEAVHDDNSMRTMHCVAASVERINETCPCAGRQVTRSEVSAFVKTEVSLAHLLAVRSIGDSVKQLMSERFRMHTSRWLRKSMRIFFTSPAHDGGAEGLNRRPLSACMDPGSNIDARFYWSADFIDPRSDVRDT